MYYVTVNGFPPAPLLKHPRLTLRSPARLKSLRAGFILFLVIFSLVQGVSILPLTRLVTTTSANVAEAHQLSNRQASLDKTRSELLSASDNRHRTGIFLMQDNQTGAVDSWKSLAEDAQLSDPRTPAV